MKSTRNITAMLLLAVLGASSGCAAKQQENLEHEIADRLPESAELAVAEDNSAYRGLTFQSDENGQVLYFAGSQLVARFMINSLDNVKLNSWKGFPSPQPWTVVTVNDKTVYESEIRSTSNRFYIVPE